MHWHQVLEIVEPHIVRITTPNGSGTGFLVHRDTRHGEFGIATAGHVVRDAFAWKQNITIHHPSFKRGAVTLGHSTRTKALLHPELDSAYVAGPLPELRNSTFPEEPMEHVPLRNSVKSGVEVGWLGYPYLVPTQAPCFFSGHVSTFKDGRYFIDGVAIPGVSGGPAFYWNGNAKPPRVQVLGSISAYSTARSGGEVSPGLMVADNCTHWPGIVGNEN